MGHPHLIARWSSAEWRSVAALLRTTFPERDFTGCTDSDLPVTMREVQDAAQRALPPERHRTKLLQLSRLKPMLYRYFVAMNAAPSAPTVTTKVFWTAAEWDRIARVLGAASPPYFTADGKVQDLTLAAFHAAQATALPLHRRRAVRQLMTARAPLEAAYRRGLSPAPAIVAAFVPPVPPPDLPAPVAPRKTRAKAAPRIQWNATEWVMVAEEMVRRNPHARYLESTLLAGITAAEVHGCQNVLSVERRRVKAISSLPPLRKPLLEAFAAIKRNNLRAAKEEADRKAEAGRIVFVPPAAPAVAPPNPFEDAVRTLARIFAEEFAKGLQPGLIAALASLVPSAVAAPVALAPLVVPAVAVATPPAVVIPYRPRVGIVGNRNTYENDLIKAFPHIEFTCIDKENQIAGRLRNCDKVIAVTSFLSHAATIAARNVAGDRYTPVQGGLSAIRHQLQVWIAAGELSGRASHG